CEEARQKDRIRVSVLVNQYAYSLNTGSTLRSQAPLNFSKSSSAGRNTARDIFLIRAKMAFLFRAATARPPRPAKSLLRQHHRCLGEMQHVLPRDPSREAQLRHVIAQLLALLGSPILDHIPGSVERVVVVEKSGPIRR